MAKRNGVLWAGGALVGIWLLWVFTVLAVVVGLAVLIWRAVFS